MLSIDTQNGKTKWRQKSQFEGELGGPLLRFAHVNIPIVASSKFLQRLAKN